MDDITGGRVAFYAPLKAPDHPVASGDRRMAQLLMEALAGAGFRPTLASRLRTYDPTGSAFDDLQDAAQVEAERLLRLWRETPETRPELWFTYHCYYKAVDFIGPVVARALNIPYAIAEASLAPRRGAGPFGRAHAACGEAIGAADTLLMMTEQDRPMLEAARRPHQHLVTLAPFVADVTPKYKQRGSDGVPQLLAVAMMRHGDKCESYRLLAAALTQLTDRPWHLTIVGDGEARDVVRGVFGPFAERVTFAGLVDSPALMAGLYESADLLVWPAVNEAYGMVFLEAASHGCPALAGNYGGVSSVVKHGESGVLTAPGDEAAFTSALARLLEDAPLRACLGKAAHAFVRSERTLYAAAATLRQALVPLIGREQA